MYITDFLSIGGLFFSADQHSLSGTLTTIKPALVIHEIFMKYL